MRLHLNKFKWMESALNASLLRQVGKAKWLTSRFPHWIVAKRSPLEFRKRHVFCRKT